MSNELAIRKLRRFKKISNNADKDNKKVKRNSASKLLTLHVAKGLLLVL